MDPDEAMVNAIPRRENFCLLSCADGATLVVVLWYRTIVDAPNLRFRDRICNLIISGANNYFTQLVYDGGTNVLCSGAGTIWYYTGITMVCGGILLLIVASSDDLFVCLVCLPLRKFPAP